ncbi:MAG: hypothetical protein AAF738_05295 [Bacteroidota bacterium]
MLLVNEGANDKFEFSNPRYITEFNAKGYNNQPKFFNRSELYITSQTPNSDQTEIYVLDFKAKKKYQVTETLESEYSPTLMPDGYNFSAIRTEGNGVQRLWQFPVDRLSDGKPILKYTENVGYHHWINSRRLALFMVDEPSYLAIANVATDEIKRSVANIGRSFYTNPTNGKLAFVHKVSNRTWYIKEMDVYASSLGAFEIVGTTLPNSEDFVITRNGTYLMGRGSKLFKYHPVKDGDKGWREILDLRTYGIQNIRRLALSEGDRKIAIVHEGEALGQY